ncbi:MAG TPA: preprotein translocase subunit SecY [Armatimonadota bacterium]|nr:preprotein translocase subunit SecY [Armatimonadota bacterium]
MLTSLVSAFRVPDLRKRLMFVIQMFALYMVALHIPLPGIDRAKMEALFQSGGLMNLLDTFSGGALRKYTILAMSITPYINASIIMQLLTVAIPQLEELQKEGEPGRKQISRYTRYLTVILAIFQAIAMNLMFKRMGFLDVNFLQFVHIVVTLTAGTMFLMWMGEMITDRGIGNGVSLIIFVGIMARIPYDIMQTIRVVGTQRNFFGAIALLAIFIFTVAAIVAITQGQRKIPIQHAKRMVGNKMYGGGSSFLPLKVNQAGVIPIIFAVSVVYLPAQIAQFAPVSGGLRTFADKIVPWFTPGAPGAPGIFATTAYALLVLFFTYFYTAVTFDVPKVSDDLRKYGSFIPGIRPGRPTADYLDKVMTRITLAGAVFLAVIALMQYYVPQWTGVTTFSLVGGTSLLIVVGVALETMQQIEAHLIMRHYEGFIR